MIEPHSPQAPRVLIVRLSSLGDLFHALPTAHNLRVATGGTLDWVVQEEYADLVRTFEGVRRVIPTSRRDFVRQLPTLWRALREERYDWVIDLQGLLKSALVVAMARGRRKIGPSYHREGSRLFYHRTAGRRDRGRHAVEQGLDVIQHLGFQRLTPSFPVRFPRVAHPADRMQVALLPVSRWPSKNWPPEHFAALARLLLRDPRLRLSLLGGAADEAVCARIAEGLDETRVANLAGRLSLVELGGWLRSMDLLIANDSGPVHMAAAVGTPTLVLFGPTDAARTGPYGPGHRIIRAPDPCAPCFRRECRRHGHPCMRDITPESVAREARAMLRVPVGRS